MGLRPRELCKDIGGIRVSWYTDYSPVVNHSDASIATKNAKLFAMNNLAFWLAVYIKT